MRKWCVAIVISLIASSSANAQVGYDDKKQEVAVTYGFLSNSQIIDAFEELSNAFAGAKFENERYVGPVSVEFFYHMKNWLGVGGVFAVGTNKQDVCFSGTKRFEVKNSYFTLMPAVKFDWLRREHFGMYSKAALGATLRSESGYTGDLESAGSSEIHFNWQLSLLGIEAGSPTTRGFLELGTGEQGLVLAGLRYKF